MSEVKWTEDQKKVIQLRNRNILVSAAAGSGKTAVLVERIITMITDKEHPIDVDKLLIVTFTKAAAAEMKERISLAIERKLFEMPESLHLQKQMTLIHSAQITTIHSFCMSVLKEHFNLLDLDPSFRVGDDTELKLLKADVIEELLESRYESSEDDFVAFIESYSSGKSDSNIEGLILQLHDFSMSYPWPLDWLNERRTMFEIESIEDLEHADFIKDLLQYIKSVITELRVLIENAYALCEETDGPYNYAPALKSDLEMLDALCGLETYREYEERLSSLAFARLSAKKDPTISEEKKAYVKAVREEVKKILGDISKNYFFQPAEEMVHDILNVKSSMNVLIDLTVDFQKLYAEKKAENNLVDFNDLEHYTLEVLVEKTEDGSRATETAVDLSHEYEEILIDEYQDSNNVQELILNSISKEKFEQPNLFMVGDVKQSIYKFRLARPELFMKKFDEYSLEDSKYQRIDLHKNFRSREIVLDSVNIIFKQIMMKELGNIDYDEAAALHVGANFAETVENVSVDTELILIDNMEMDDKKASVDKTDKGKISKEKKEEQKEENEYSVKELEAKAIAARIRALTDIDSGLFVTDKGSYRKAEYRDIVILLRTISGWADVFMDILMSEGIPAYTETQTGYFSALEIKTILNILKVVDNPRQDIPLAAVLYSPIVGLTSNELAEVRANHKKLDLYDAVLTYNGENEGLEDRLERFLEQLEEFRMLSTYTPIHRLIQIILEKTGYYHYVMAMPAGERRSANIDMLVQRAVNFEATSYHGLFQFNRYIEKLHKYEVDFGEAGVTSENENAVRIMSIHKSKGLEFPIVFVSGLGKSFNQQDARSKLILHPDLGIGPDFIDYKLRLKAPTLIKKVMQRKTVLENLGEELRVLYVALTRAKEKLILTGVVSDLAERLKKWSYIKEQKQIKLLFYKLTGAGNYLDWIVPSLIRMPCFAPVLSRYDICPEERNYIETKADFRIRILTLEELAETEILKQVETGIQKEDLLSWDIEQVYDDEIQEQIEEYSHYVYPYSKEVDIHGKITVTELKRYGQMIDDEESEKLYDTQDNKAHINQKVIKSIDSFIKDEFMEKEVQEGIKDESESYKNNEVEQISFWTEEETGTVPKFLLGETEVKGSTRGSLYHKVLEKIPLGSMKTKKEIKSQLESLVASQLIEQEEMKLISINKLHQFGSSELAKRMQKAEQDDKLHRERQFVMGIPANEISKEFESNELVLVQGIIDVFFEEGDELVLMDYKTDRINKPEELIERYRTQLDYYKTALEKTTGMQVKQKIIYSFSLGKEIIF